MSNINYEEGYFKLKKSNEDLTVLINKVINDFKQTKAQLLGEKDKNSVIIKRNASLEKQVTEITKRFDEQFHELEDLKDENASLKTYTKAVEGVAENYCGKNMETESKYKHLKRKSTMMFSQLTKEASIALDLSELDDLDSVFSPSPSVSPIPDLTEVKKPYEEKLAKEKIKKTNLREDIKELKSEIERLKDSINSLKTQYDETIVEKEKIQSDLNILSQAHSTLHADHEDMLRCFSPYLKMKSDNLELKRTSAVLLNDIGNDARLAQFVQIIDEFKSESVLKDLKIKELESQVDATALTIEIGSLKMQLEDLSDKIMAANKERDTAVHENRILREQKGGPGVPAPPPPAPPPPPPPPPTNKLLNLFKPKHPKQNISKDAPPKAEKQVLVDLMSELQKKLENKCRNEKLKMNSPLVNQSSVDIPDGAKAVSFIKLRSNSVPNMTPIRNEDNELRRAFNRRKIMPIDENTS